MSISNYFWGIKNYESKHFDHNIVVSEFGHVFKIANTQVLQASFEKFDFKLYINFAHWGKVSCISKPRHVITLQFDYDKILLRVAHQIPRTGNTYKLTSQTVSLVRITWMTWRTISDIIFYRKKSESNCLASTLCYWLSW